MAASAAGLRFLFGHIAVGAQAQTNPPRLENAALRIELSAADGSLTVLDKRDNLTWRQEARPGYRVDPGSLRITPNSLSCQVSSTSGNLSLTITLTAGTDSSFDLKIENGDLHYVAAPGYPFHFLAPGRELVL